MTLLSVNVNKIALLRNSRKGNIPHLLELVAECVNAGAGGITVHPRPDQRHIRPQDAVDISEAIDTEFNLEGNPLCEPAGTYPGLVAIAERVLPTQCTLVPDSEGQSTSDHGWDLKRYRQQILPIIARLKDLGIRVSVFVDPVIEQIKLARNLGADRIELFTGPYAAAYEHGDTTIVLDAYRKAAEAASGVGLGINAGHDLNLKNLRPFLAVGQILEVSIGHALIADALKWGLSDTIRRYRLVLAGEKQEQQPFIAS
jgi:pyridoxine 5-phosphate synthase